MSDLIAAGASALAGRLGIAPLYTDWRTRLLPASFRGVAFFVETHEEIGGRRAAVHEFPLRDLPAVEDLGAAARRYMIEGYLVGADYDLARDAIRKAMFDTAGPGTLVHPYLGRLTVQVIEGCSVRESRALGRRGDFRLACVQAGDVSQSRASIDTGAGVLNQVSTVIQALKLAFTIGVLVANHPGFVLAALASGLESFAGDLLGLPAGVVQGLAGDIAAITADVTDPEATSDAIGTVFDDAGTALVAAPPAGSDPTGGLAALAAWSGAVGPNAVLTPASQQQATNAALLTALVQGGAVATTAAIAAQTDYVSAQAATAARTQLIALIDAQAVLAADSGDGCSYAAWLALGAAVAADLITRAQNLPQLAAYALGGSLPSLALVQRLYADTATTDEADALAALNDAIHPLFMPSAGIWLQEAS